MLLKEEEELLALCRRHTWDSAAISRLRQLTTSSSVDVNCVNRDTHTPLMLVCIRNESQTLRECVNILLRNRDVDVTVKTFNGNNALHLLCSNNNSPQMMQVAQLLIENGVDVNDTNNKGRTALQNLQGRRDDLLNKAEMIELISKGATTTAAAAAAAAVQ